jgi:type 1 glutamine amidotransferase
MMNRREMIRRTGAAALGLGLAGCATSSSCDAPKTKKVLFFSKSSGFEHSVIKTVNGQPSFAQKILTELGPKHDIDFTFSKDGSLFTPEYLAQFDAYFFYTTGSLTDAGTDKNPPMTPEGKAAFLDAIKRGKGFIGTHSAADTFHTGEGAEGWKNKGENRYKNFGKDADPYVRMLGAEFIIHGKQQPSKISVIDPKFPGFQNMGDSFSWTEEWYSLKDFSDNLHVILVQGTEGMVGEPYQRPPYPETWARKHGKGRVFYTSLGHREDVWTNPHYHDMLFGGIAWAVRNVNADVTPNIKEVTPRCWELPPPNPPAKPK